MSVTSPSGVAAVSLWAVAVAVALVSSVNDFGSSADKFRMAWWSTTKSPRCVAAAAARLSGVWCSGWRSHRPARRRAFEMAV